MGTTCVRNSYDRNDREEQVSWLFTFGSRTAPRDKGTVASHGDLGGGLPDTLGVVTEAHVVGAGDGLAAVLALLAEEGLDGIGEGGAASAHVEVLTVVALGVSQAAERGDVVGPLLGAGDERVVPLEGLVADILAGLVVEIEGLLLVGGEAGRSGAGAGCLGGLGLLGLGLLSHGLGLLGDLGRLDLNVGGLGGSDLLLGLLPPLSAGSLLLDGSGLLLDRGGLLRGRVGRLGTAGGNDLGDIGVLGDDLVVGAGSGHGAGGHKAHDDG
ncbi:hypothetical protein HG530_012293 [Fusarium avenaceum]|nr:hypothetical protein HG530_012293 [Fusarium avenaceum]